MVASRRTSPVVESSRRRAVLALIWSATGCVATRAWRGRAIDASRTLRGATWANRELRRLDAELETLAGEHALRTAARLSDLSQPTREDLPLASATRTLFDHAARAARAVLADTDQAPAARRRAEVWLRGVLGCSLECGVGVVERQRDWWDLWSRLLSEPHAFAPDRVAVVDSLLDDLAATYRSVVRERSRCARSLGVGVPETYALLRGSSRIDARGVVERVLSATSPGSGVASPGSLGMTGRGEVRLGGMGQSGSVLGAPIENSNARAWLEQRLSTLGVALPHEVEVVRAHRGVGPFVSAVQLPQRVIVAGPPPEDGSWNPVSLLHAAGRVAQWMSVRTEHAIERGYGLVSGLRDDSFCETIASVFELCAFLPVGQRAVLAPAAELAQGRRAFAESHARFMADSLAGWAFEVAAHRDPDGDWQAAHRFIRSSFGGLQPRFTTWQGRILNVFSAPMPFYGLCHVVAPIVAAQIHSHLMRTSGVGYWSSGALASFIRVVVSRAESLDPVERDALATGGPVAERAFIADLRGSREGC